MTHMDRSRPSDAIAYELDGLARLGAARDGLDLVVSGRWLAAPATVAAIGQLVEAGRLRLLWAEMAAAA